MNYIPDSLYAQSPSEMKKLCSDCLPTCIGCIKSTERGIVNCPFGMNPQKGIFFKEQQLPNTQWGRAPQLDPRSLNRIGMEWRN